MTNLNKLSQSYRCGQTKHSDVCAWLVKTFPFKGVARQTDLSLVTKQIFSMIQKSY